MKTVKIPLSQGKFAIIDEQDEANSWRYIWHVHHGAGGLLYASTAKTIGSTQLLLLHRYLLDAPPAFMSIIKTVMDLIVEDAICDLLAMRRINKTEESRLQRCLLE